jgi:hypothetical protein
MTRAAGSLALAPIAVGGVADPRGEIHWLVLGLTVLAGALIVHWWVVRATRRAAA